MPDTEYSWPQPTTYTLQTYAPRMLHYNNAIRTLERRLAIEKSAVTKLPPDDARKAAYEQKRTVLDIAKAILGRLIDIDTKVVEEQIEKPGMTLKWSAERANENLEKGLSDVEDALGEMRYLMWGM